MNFTLKKYWGVILCLGFILIGCNTESGVDKPPLIEHYVKNHRVFLNTKNTPFLVRPIDIKANSSGLYVVDSGSYQIHKIDSSGNLQMSFGNQGRGPGEFLSISGFWPLKNNYLIYDYNGFKFLIYDHHGNLINEEVIKENPVNPDSEFAIPITLEVLSSKRLIIPTGGKNGSLFAIVDRISGNVAYKGKAIGKAIEEYNNQKVMQAYSSGEIPDAMVNLVMLSSSSNSIYSLQQTTGILEKYTHAGEKIWEKELNIPAQKNLFDQIAQDNIDFGVDNGRRFFMYVRAMDANEKGVALLLNMPEDQPLTVAWVPKDGKKIHLVEVEGKTLDVHGFTEGFTVSLESKKAYYLERSVGTIYQFEWPL